MSGWSFDYASGKPFTNGVRDCGGSNIDGAEPQLLRGIGEGVDTSRALGNMSASGCCQRMGLASIDLEGGQRMVVFTARKRDIHGVPY